VISGNGCGTAVLSGEKPQRRVEFRNSELGDVPNFVQVDADLVVNQDVAHAADGLPLEVGEASRASAETGLAASP
jgi:hypothetical protein